MNFRKECSCFFSLVAFPRLAVGNIKAFESLLIPLLILVPIHVLKGRIRVLKIVKCLWSLNVAIARGEGGVDIEGLHL